MSDLRQTGRGDALSHAPGLLVRQHDRHLLRKLRVFLAQDAVALLDQQVAADAGVSKLLIGHYSSRNTDQCLYEAECREVFPESYAAADGDVYEI